jgi:hypothetical protein
LFISCHTLFAVTHPAVAGGLVDAQGLFHLGGLLGSLLGHQPIDVGGELRILVVELGEGDFLWLAGGLSALLGRAIETFAQALGEQR